MEERPLVYVNRITNLSDARYCAGMGVDFLGFVMDPADPDYVSPELYHDLVGWVSGPARVLEIGEAIFNEDQVQERYAPDFLHIPYSRLGEFANTRWKLMVEIPVNQWAPGLPSNPQLAFWILAGLSKPSLSKSDAPYFISGPSFDGSVAEHLRSCGARGIVLSGSQESAPGLKDYDHLSQVLEELNG